MDAPRLPARVVLAVAQVEADAEPLDPIGAPDPDVEAVLPKTGERARLAADEVVLAVLRVLDVRGGQRVLFGIDWLLVLGDVAVGLRS